MRERQGVSESETGTELKPMAVHNSLLWVTVPNQGEIKAQGQCLSHSSLESEQNQINSNFYRERLPLELLFMCVTEKEEEERVRERE